MATAATEPGPPISQSVKTRHEPEHGMIRLVQVHHSSARSRHCRAEFCETQPREQRNDSRNQPAQKRKPFVHPRAVKHVRTEIKYSRSHHDSHDDTYSAENSYLTFKLCFFGGQRLPFYFSAHFILIHNRKISLTCGSLPTVTSESATCRGRLPCVSAARGSVSSVDVCTITEIFLYHT